MASIDVGQHFSTDALEALLEDVSQIRSITDRLCEKQLLVRTPDDEDRLSFSHGLLRDVAYGGLLRQRRADLHERFAKWLEVEMVERRGQYLEVIGFHCEQAYEHLVTLAPLDDRGRRLAERGGVLLGEAGRRALTRGDSPAAVSLLERATSLLSPTDPRHAEFALKLSIALAEVGEFERADALLGERLDAARRQKTLLVYRDARGREQMLDLADGRRVTVGRRFENDLALPWDSAVSRQHAAIESTDTGWVVLDPGLSRHGSYVNGERVRGRQPLSDGDVLRFGDTVVLFRAPVKAADAVAPAHDESAVTSLGRTGLTALDASERELLNALAAEDLTNAPPSDLSSLDDEERQTLEALARRSAAEHLPPAEQRRLIVARAKGIGLVE